MEDTIYEELNVGEITRDKDGCRVQDISKKVIAEISILRSCKSPAQFSVTKYLLHFSQIKSEIPQLNICKNEMQEIAEKLCINSDKNQLPQPGTPGKDLRQ